MYENIAFEVPAKFAAGVADGTIKRFGAILWDTATKHIVGHLQEAGTLSLSAGLEPLGALMGTTKSLVGASAVFSGVGAIAAIVGVGVSVLGFAQVKNRLSAIDRTLAVQDRKLSDIQNKLGRAELRAWAMDAARVESILADAEEAWHRGDPAAHLRTHVDNALRHAEMYWRTVLGSRDRPGMLLSDAFSLEEAFSAYGHVIQLAAVRIQVLMVEDELSTARSYADEISRWHAGTTRNITAVDLAAARTSGPLDPSWRSTRDIAQSALGAVREADLFLGQRVQLLDALAEHRISPRAYIESARSREGELVFVGAVCP